MRAAVLEGIKKITIRDDVPEPAIGPSDVLVRAKACGICGTDVHIWEGDFFPTFPLIPGHGVVRVEHLIHEAMPIEELPRGLDMMKRGAAAMKLQVVWS